MAVILDGEELTGVTAINLTPDFEDIYNVHAGSTYKPSAAGERGWMKETDAALADGTSVWIQVDYTPLFIEQNT